MFNTFKTILLAGAVTTSFVASSAQAASIIGLVDGKSIVTIDPKSRKVTQTANIKGAATLLGIDVRPADGMIYGVTTDGMIVTVDAKTGQATMKSKLSDVLKAGVVATVDFNPVADRIRLMGSDGTSLRVNVDDGNDRGRLAQVQGRRCQCGQDPSRRGGRLFEFLEGHDGDGTLQHRCSD